MSIQIHCLLSALLVFSPAVGGLDKSQDPFVVQVSGSGSTKGFRATGKPATFSQQGWGKSCFGLPDCHVGFEPPNVAPHDLTTWRRNGWCSPDERIPCPDKAIREWVLRHNQVRTAAHKGMVPGGSFLACKAMGGIGNYVVGLVSCMAFAMVTGRSLLLASPPDDPKGQKHKYDFPVGVLFEFPLEMSLQPLGVVADIPIVLDERNDEVKTGLKLIDIRFDDLLCRNLNTSYTAPIAVLPSHLWLGVLPHNKHHGQFFTDHFGRDDLGISHVVSFLGPWLVRPKAHLLVLLHELARTVSMHPDGTVMKVVGLQARLGLPDKDLPTEFPPPGTGQEYVRCAISYLPTKLRDSRLAWVVVGDSGSVRRDMLMKIADLEGPVVAAGNEAALRGLGLPHEYYAAGNVLGAASVQEVYLDPALKEFGFAVAVFASGSRAVVLANPPDLSSLAGMETAVLEMWLLGYARFLVVTENSTFWIPSVSFVRKGREESSVFIFTRNKRCYPLPTREPVTDGGYRSRRMTNSTCYDDSILNPTLTWLPYDSPK